jgi:1-deoxy-D-xylulose-5-phosphate synthase
MSLLDKVNTPLDLKDLNTEELAQLCSEVREYMIECCACNPGHLGASLGAVELCVALHYVFDTPKDKVVFDVGHQAYAHKIITGRKEAFKNNRKYKGISGFPKISESPYDSFGTGHSSTSISSALGLAVAGQMSGENYKVTAVIGDGALTGGLAFEALNNAGSMKTDILVILNDNQISIDQNTGALHNHLLKITTSRTYNSVKNKVWNRLGGASKLRSGVQAFVNSTKNAILQGAPLFESLGFRYFGVIDGNNIEQMVETLAKLKNIKGPKLLHIITTKGKGFKPAEEDQTVWHAPGTFDPKTGKRTVKTSDIARYQDVFGETLLQLAKQNPKIVGISPAMLSGCGMNYLAKEMPERVFDVGIAESHAVTFTAGLAAGGMIPVCNIYSSFMQRAYDNIIHDIALQNLKAIICLDRAGIVGEDGATHHGCFDIAALRPIPNLTIAAPLNELELKNMLYSATLPEYPTTVIRYPRGNGQGVSWRDEPWEMIPVGKGQLLHDGEKIALLSIGAIGNKAAQAVSRAEGDGIRALHYDMRFIKPIDKDILAEVCKKASTIITVEDGALYGGLHSAVAEYIAEHGLDNKLIGMGIPDRFVEQGTVAELQHECSYDADAIYDTIIKNH